jgi:hypothetical protein
MCTALPCAEYYQRVRLPRRRPDPSGALPFGVPYSTLSQDRRGSPRFPIPPSPTLPRPHAPPGSPAASPFAAAYCCLPGTRPCRPPVNDFTRLTRLHSRYGRVVARPTLSQRRCRLLAQGSIPGGWLALTGTGISPAEGIELTPRLRITTSFLGLFVLAPLVGIQAECVRRPRRAVSARDRRDRRPQGGRDGHARPPRPPPPRQLPVHRLELARQGRHLRGDRHPPRRCRARHRGHIRGDGTTVGQITSRRVAETSRLIEILAQAA